MNILFFVIAILLAVILLLMFKINIIEKSSADLIQANEDLLDIFNDLSEQLNSHLQE